MVSLLKINSSIIETMPTSSKPIVFLAFSNDDNRPLSSLAKERLEIEKAFEPLHEQGKCELIVKGGATIDDIFKVFNHRDNRNRIALFHYAGHADGNGLHLISKEGNNKTANVNGLADFFGMQKNLKLIFLNGCSTENQVEVLQNRGIENVIATVKEIDDDVASMIAAKFYEVFTQNEDIDKSFKAACAYVKAQKVDGDNTRKLWKNRFKPSNAFPWANTFKSGDWRLVNYRPIDNPFKVFLAYSFEDEPVKSKLDRQLAVLKRRGLIDVFSETGVEAGSDTNAKVMEHLNTAHIVLLFVSDNLFYDAAGLIDEVVKRYERDAITLIPVYMRKCVIEDAKFAQLSPLPRKDLQNGKVVRFVNEWNNEDMAYYEIAKGLRDLIVSVKQQNS